MDIEIWSGDWKSPSIDYCCLQQLVIFYFLFCIVYSSVWYCCSSISIQYYMINIDVWRELPESFSNAYRRLLEKNGVKISPFEGDNFFYLAFALLFANRFS